jgi:hypothetical protein
MFELTSQTNGSFVVGISKVLVVASRHAHQSKHFFFSFRFTKLKRKQKRVKENKKLQSRELETRVV